MTKITMYQGLVFSALSLFVVSGSAKNTTETQPPKHTNGYYYLSLETGAAFLNGVTKSQSVDLPNMPGFYTKFLNAHDELRVTPLFGVSGGYGWHTSPRWDIRAGLSLDQTVPDRTNGTITNLAGETTRDFTYKTSSTVILANFDLAYDMCPLVPYVTFGLGYAWNRVDGYNESDTSNGTDLTDFATYKETTAGNFAYKVGLGADYKINKKLSIGLQYAYWGLGNSRLSGGHDLAGALTDINTGRLKMQTILAKLNYHF